MRIKDAVTVAHVLGRELRFATADETEGLRTAVGAIRGHLERTMPDFDLDVYDEAVFQAVEGRAFV